MGVFGAENKDGKNTGFGNLVSLRPIDNNIINEKSDTTTTTTAVTTSINKNKNSTTRIICIPESLYKRFVEHSRRFYNVESYDTILNNLLNCYEENHKEMFWYNRDR